MIVLQPICFDVGIQLLYPSTPPNPLFFFVVLQAKSGPGRFIVDVSGSLSLSLSHGRTALNERSARHTGRYLHNTQHAQNRTSMPSAVSEPLSQQSSGRRTKPHGYGVRLPYSYLSTLFQLLRPIILNKVP